MNKTLRSISAVAMLFVAMDFVGCQSMIVYHFPKEKELIGIKADSLKWKYSGRTVLKVPVADDNGLLWWLDVTPKTKLEVLSTEKEVYRFYLRSLVITDDADGIFGSSALWTGYDLLQHTNRSLPAREISSLKVLSETPATERIVN